MAMAQACGSRVEVEAARTEYSQTFASPDGSGKLTIETSVLPQRAKRLDGSWGAIDTFLTRVGDRLVPVAAAASVWFSTGGTGPFASMTVEGRTMTLSWPGELPTPSVEGDTATYPDVVPDVDLVVRATDSGFSHSLVVRSARGAADPRVRRSGYAIGGDVTMESTVDGGLVAKAGETVVARAPAPLMWDTATPLSEREMALAGIEQPLARVVKGVVARANGRELVLEPDVSLLDGGRYPVTVDPPWNPGQSQWAYATSNNTNAPMTDGKIASGDPSPAAPILRSGDDTTGRLNRSFMRFAIGTVAGKHILDVGLAGRVDHTWKCGVNYPNYFYRTAAIGTTPRQSWPGPALQLLLGNNSVHANEDSCNDPNMVFEVSTTTLINDVQTAANNSNSYYYVGVCACSSSSGSGEGTTERWMRYFLNDFRLNISYNTKPGVPSTLTVDNKACATGANRPFIKTATPTLRAHASDADGNSMTVQFQTARIKHDATAGPVSLTLQQTSIPNGGTGMVTVPAGVLDTTDTFTATGDWDSDGKPDVISRDAAGELYLLPGTGNGNLESRTRIGHSFSGYTFAPGMADWDKDGHQDFIVREDATGILWLYTGNSQRAAHGPRFQIGSGWGGYALTGVSDWDKDGNMDIQARDSAGVMWLYPGESTRTASTQARVTLGSGWSTSGVTYFGAKDWDRDGNPDLVIYDGAGTLWGYPGSGTRGLYGTRFQLGSGWTGFDGALIPDVGGDGKVDIIANPANQTHWVIYPGTGDRTFPGPAPYTVATVGASDRAQFAFHANAYDGTDWAPNPSAWCEFEVDLRPPAVPTVTTDLYTEGSTPKGSVGQTGRFTFSSSSDTQSFLYGFSDPPTTPLTPGTLGGSVSFDYTPASGGPKTLFVRAIDRAGNEANRIYQFYVAPETTALGRWKLNEFPGTTTLIDDTGNGRDMTVLNGATLGQPGRLVPGLDGVSRTALGFDGVDDRAEASGPVIPDTSKSFSVSAWAKVSDTATNHSIVAVSGTTNSVFWLESTTAGFWGVTSNKTDTGPGNTPAVSTSPVRLNTWTHLAMTFDSAAQTLRLYVNGALESTVTGVTMYDGNGPLRLGGVTQPFKGSMAEAQVWDRMISATEVFDLYDPIKVSKVGEWRMEEIGPGPAFDSSGLAHDLTFYNGALIPASGAGQSGTGLRLDGVDDYAAPSEPVIYTDQSFTVSAWVKVTATTTFETFLAQEGIDGQTNPGFLVYYDNSNNQWKIKMHASPTADETTVTLSAGTATTPTSYHHLVGVFDAQKRELRLYVDNALVVTRAMNAAWAPWNSTGRFLIGRGQGGASPAFADMDEIRVYQGVVTDVTRIP